MFPAAAMKPRKTIVPLPAGLDWPADGSIYQEKLDGEFRLLETPSGKLAGEQLGEHFIAFDAVEYGGADCAGAPLFERLKIRDAICRQHGIASLPHHADGALLLRAVLARGGEGVVRKLPGSRYGDPMEACTRVITFRCRVAELLHATETAVLVDAESGQPRGSCAMRRQWNRFRVGSLVKIEGLGEHRSGRIREPRPCKDSHGSWLISY